MNNSAIHSGYNNAIICCTMLMCTESIQHKMNDYTAATQHLHYNTFSFCGKPSAEKIYESQLPVTLPCERSYGINVNQACLIKT